MIGLRQRAWWTAGVTGTVALAVVPSVGRPLTSGGLAPVLVAALIAALIGVPLARVEWRHRLASATRVDVAVDALGELLVVGWITAVAALTWPAPWSGLLGVTLWLVAVGAVAVRRESAAVGLAVLCVAQVVLVSALGWAEAPPWTLLSPRWEAWHTWLPWSLMSGLLLAGAGVSQWSRGPEGPPGTGHTVWLPAGVAVGVTTAAACRVGSRFEVDLGPAPDALGLGVGALALAAAATAALAAAPARRKRLGFAGGIAALWFGGPGAGATGWFLNVWLPLGVLVVLARHAARYSGTPRWIAALGAGLGAAALALAWPGVPSSPPVAVAAALTGVAIAWVAGTRALLEAP